MLAVFYPIKWCNLILHQWYGTIFPLMHETSFYLEPHTISLSNFASPLGTCLLAVFYPMKWYNILLHRWYGTISPLFDDTHLKNFKVVVCILPNKVIHFNFASMIWDNIASYTHNQFLFGTRYNFVIYFCITLE